MPITFEKSDGSIVNSNFRVRIDSKAFRAKRPLKHVLNEVFNELIYKIIEAIDTEEGPCDIRRVLTFNSTLEIRRINVPEESVVELDVKFNGMVDYEM